MAAPEELLKTNWPESTSSAAERLGARGGGAVGWSCCGGEAKEAAARVREDFVKIGFLRLSAKIFCYANEA